MMLSIIRPALILFVLSSGACRTEASSPSDAEGALPPGAAESPLVGSPPPGGTSGTAGSMEARADETVDLIDPSIPAAVAGAEGWGYSRVAEADLTGDGATERVVLTARVEMYQGRPAWDDGQPWQVYVEATDGSRTYLYARRLQLGTLEMRVTSASSGQPPSVVLIEHLPDQLSVYEAVHDGLDDFDTVARFVRTLDPRGETASPTLP